MIDARSLPDRYRYGFCALFGQERSADVEFEVGPDGASTWRLTAHSRVLATTSPVMHALLRGPLAPVPPIRVNDVDPRAFECFLRYLYGLPPELQTVSTALATLYVAHKYLCPHLEWECASFLNEQMQSNPNSVLDILQAVSFYCQRKQHLEPSAPPVEDLDSDSEGTRLVQDLKTARQLTEGDLHIGDASARLRHNCLQLIDQHADHVLTLEQIEDLDLEALVAVMSRDTLWVSNELLVFRAVEKWAQCECKRRKQTITREHLRQALGGPKVIGGGRLARFLLLSHQEFADIPARSLVLSDEEQRSLLVHLVLQSDPKATVRDVANHSPSHIDWVSLSTPRVKSTPEYLAIPSIYPTSRHESPKNTKDKRWGFRWPRSKRKRCSTAAVTVRPARMPKEKKDKPPPDEERPTCCSRTCDVLISAIACLFD